MRFLIAVVELVMLFVVLTVILVLSPFSALVVALAFCLLGLFAVFTGRGMPRLRGRINGASILVIAGFMALIASQEEQRQTRWAELRQTDPNAYLAELAPVNETRWLEELRELRPEDFAQEVARREAEAEAQREAEAAEAARRADAEAAERRAESDRCPCS
jgi:ABC-type multidrug transport system fused ATPase/permease subunit